MLFSLILKDERTNNTQVLCGGCMIRTESFFLFSSGGAPDWPPCIGCVATLEGENGEFFSPEFLTSANAFVSDN